MDAPDVEALLARLARGDAEAGEALFPLVYRELHGTAHRLMARERAGHTLQTTALLHEAWVRIAGGDAGRIQDRQHFVRLASRAMRNVLVDQGFSLGTDLQVVEAEGAQHNESAWALRFDDAMRFLFPGN